MKEGRFREQRQGRGSYFKMSILTKILKAPLILLVIFSFIAAVYAAQNNIQGITKGIPIILGVYIGVFMEKGE